MHATGLGRDAIFLGGGVSQHDLTLACRAAVALGAEGFALPGGFRFEQGRPVCDTLDVLLLQTGEESAVVFEAQTPRGQEALRGRIAVLDQTKPVPELLLGVVQGESVQGTDPMTASDRMRFYGLGGSDLATVRRIARMSPDKRVKTLVFLAGMLGQDLADALGGALGVGRVTQDDIPSMMMYSLKRLDGHPQMIARLLLALADEVPPRENTAIHLALGPQ